MSGYFLLLTRLRAKYNAGFPPQISGSPPPPSLERLRRHHHHLACHHHHIRPGARLADTPKSVQRPILRLRAHIIELGVCLAGNNMVNSYGSTARARRNKNVLVELKCLYLVGS